MESDGLQMKELELPGFRFHPTEQELLGFYLKNVATGKRDCSGVISFLNIYRHDPWELPGLARNGEREWYFFVPRDKKVGTGGRPNRTTEKGFWKATGSDRKIFSTHDHKHIGLRKTLVFYNGRAPQGRKTDWVMNEYRLPDSSPLPKSTVLCKVYRKATSLKILEQRAATEEALNSNQQPPLGLPPPSYDQLNGPMGFEEEWEQKDLDEAAAGGSARRYNHNFIEKFRAGGSSSPSSSSSVSSRSSPPSPSALQQVLCAGGKLTVTELQVPSSTQDWTQDGFWAQLSSPWLQAAFTPNYANMINF